MMLTVREIAEDLKLKPDTITAYLREGRIKGTRSLGGVWRVLDTDYEAFKESLFPTPSETGFSPRNIRSKASKKAAHRRHA